MIPDICVVVEGTYPYVTGGVSTWLQNLIAHLPEFTFTIFHLGSKPEPGRSIQYELPPNVVGLQEVFLNDPASLRPPARSRHSPRRWQHLRSFHAALAEGRLEESLEALRGVVAPGADRLDPQQLLFSREAWDLLVEWYEADWSSTPFLNYFWTFRSTHLPLFILSSVSLPPARLYHTLSTGYAGTAAALAKLQTGRPLILTEHGVYTREREIEIALAAWMDQAVEPTYRLNSHHQSFKTWWIRMFHGMSKFTYHMCDRIVSITQSNQTYQLREGAEPSKLCLIPNGIDVDRFRPLGRQRPPGAGAFTAGFVGRVVPIKDVKTFIQAIKIASASIPGLRALIVGPTDEDADYFAECQELTALLELEAVVRFTGTGDVRAHYPEMDVVVLSSLSEAQPLVILEANCAGIPVVASDVGACRDLAEGITAEDRALGPSGLLTLPASPHETAEAIIRLWRDKRLRQQLAAAGQERVRRFYREEAVYAAYRELYQAHLHGCQASVGEGAIWPA